MILTRHSPCKVNLLLNILGKRPDGFHALETVIQPIAVFDVLTFQRGDRLDLACSDPNLPVDSRNLVHRAATEFFKAAEIPAGVRIHLEKRIPVAAGLGGGSGNAAVTLLSLNELFGNPLQPSQMHGLAASIGSDVPFFLQSKPALAVGRGEQIESVDPFPALAGKSMLLVHPGFGVSTAWAYQHLAEFTDALNGKPGRAQKLIQLLGQADLRPAAAEFYNALEFPVLRKYPLLAIIREFLEREGAIAARMSGSGSTLFGIIESEQQARVIEQRVRDRFASCWTAVVPV